MEAMLLIIGLVSGLVLGIILGFALDNKFRMMLYDKIKKLESKAANDEKD